jgi:hypothetical protein
MIILVEASTLKQIVLTLYVTTWNARKKTTAVSILTMKSSMDHIER